MHVPKLQLLQLLQVPATQHLCLRNACAEAATAATAASASDTALAPASTEPPATLHGCMCSAVLAFWMKHLCSVSCSMHVAFVCVCVCMCVPSSMHASCIRLCGARHMPPFVSRTPRATVQLRAAIRRRPSGLCRNRVEMSDRASKQCSCMHVDVLPHRVRSLAVQLCLRHALPPPSSPSRFTKLLMAAWCTSFVSCVPPDAQEGHALMEMGKPMPCWASLLYVKVYNVLLALLYVKVYNVLLALLSSTLSWRAQRRRRLNRPRPGLVDHLLLNPRLLSLLCVGAQFVRSARGRDAAGARRRRGTLPRGAVFPASGQLRVRHDALKQRPAVPARRRCDGGGSAAAGSCGYGSCGVLNLGCSLYSKEQWMAVSAHRCCHGGGRVAAGVRGCGWCGVRGLRW
eukprot:360510-Chlamydomonas_euryale.AAC.3